MKEESSKLKRSSKRREASESKREKKLSGSMWLTRQQAECPVCQEVLDMSEAELRKHDKKLSVLLDVTCSKVLPSMTDSRLKFYVYIDLSAGVDEASVCYDDSEVSLFESETSGVAVAGISSRMMEELDEARESGESEELVKLKKNVLLKCLLVFELFSGLQTELVLNDMRPEARTSLGKSFVSEKSWTLELKRVGTLEELELELAVAGFLA